MNQVPHVAPELEVPAEVQPGALIADKYRVERVLGAGGMGVVMQAEHLQLHRTVAIKFIRQRPGEDQEAIERLLQEARAAAQIRSEHVVRVLDVGTLSSGKPFIVMEYLEGEDLANLLREQGRLPMSLAADWVLQGCEALAEAHQRRIVHRDLKPANLFVTRLPDGSTRVKLMDFGIAKSIDSVGKPGLTSPEFVLGSAQYMSPEQMQGQPVDERSDIWSLGTMLYEMVTGEHAFPGVTSPEVCARVLSGEAAPMRDHRPNVPEGFERLVMRCLQREPSQRFADVAELAEALAQFGSSLGQLSARRIVGSYRPQTPGSGTEPLGDSDHLTARLETQSAEHEGGSKMPSQGAARRWLVAAVILTASGGGFFLWALNSTDPQSPQRAKKASAGAPGPATSARPEQTAAAAARPEEAAARPKAAPAAAPARTPGELVQAESAQGTLGNDGALPNPTAPRGASGPPSNQPAGPQVARAQRAASGQASAAAPGSNPASPAITPPSRAPNAAASAPPPPARVAGAADQPPPTGPAATEPTATGPRRPVAARNPNAAPATPQPKEPVGVPEPSAPSPRPSEPGPKPPAPSGRPDPGLEDAWNPSNYGPRK